VKLNNVSRPEMAYRLISYENKEFRDNNKLLINSGLLGEREGSDLRLQARGRGRVLFLFRTNRDRLWGPPGLLPSRYGWGVSFPRVTRLETEAGHLVSI
jgi:hypothetical protein